MSHPEYKYRLAFNSKEDAILAIDELAHLFLEKSALWRERAAERILFQ